MKTLNYSYWLLFIAVLSFSCQPDGEVLEKSKVQFSFSATAISNGRTSEENPISIIVSIESESGELLLDQQRISISKFGNGYISDPLLLGSGAYNVTKFLVLNNNNEIIYATPIKGSVLAGLIDRPLPLPFQIFPDEITELNLEVISIASHDPEDLGYSTFSFNVVPIQEILVSVISQNQSGSRFISADLTVYGDSDSLYTATLGDSINVISLRKDFEEVTFKVKAGSKVQTISMPGDTLVNFRTTPLTIVFKDLPDIATGLIAYYPFTGNANDASGNELDGSVYGAILSTDRKGIPGNAYEFTGNNDVIVVAHDDLLNIKHELTISTWINLYSGNINGSRIVDKVVSGTGVGFLLDIYNTNSIVQQKNTIRFVGTEGFTAITTNEVSLGAWNHIVATYSGGEVKIYLNGELISVTHEEATVLSTNTENLQIGNDLYGAGPSLYDPFKGKIDDVRIYNRALNAEEVNLLFNL